MTSRNVTANVTENATAIGTANGLQNSTAVDQHRRRRNTLHAIQSWQSFVREKERGSARENESVIGSGTGSGWGVTTRPSRTAPRQPRQPPLSHQWSDLSCTLPHPVHRRFPCFPCPEFSPELTTCLAVAGPVATTTRRTTSDQDLTSGKRWAADLADRHPQRKVDTWWAERERTER